MQADLFTPKHNYPALKARVDAYNRSVRDRMVAAYVEAFGGAAHAGDFNSCTMHNSLIDLERGKPWREVNYSAMRRARWLADDVQWRASRVLDRMYARLGHKQFSW